MPRFAFGNILNEVARNLDVGGDIRYNLGTVRV